MSEHKAKQQATETGLQIHHLDDDCLGQILTRAAAFQSDQSELECKARSACGPLLRVCRRFRDVLLGRASRAIISPGREALLRFACGLRVLSVYFPTVGRLSLSPPIVECLSGVTQLEMCNARHSDSIRDFAALPALAELRLLNVLVPTSEADALLNHVAQLSFLTFLDVNRAALDGALERSFAGLTNLRQLRTLRLVDCSTATSACLCFVTALTGLSDLSLHGLSALDADGCIELASALPGLVALDVDYEDATDVGLAHLSSLTLLSMLDLSEAHRSTRQARLQAVTRLRSLRWLDLSVHLGGDEVGNNDVPPVLQLGMLQRLESLELYAERWQQVSALQGLTALTCLCIDCSELDGCEAAVAALTSLVSLRKCSLQAWPGDPATRAALGALRGLTRLELHGSVVGGTLPELSSLTSLEDLRFGGSHLSEEGLAETLAAVAAAPLRSLMICDYCSGGFLLTALAALSSLTRLHIDIDTITDAQLAAVSTLARLRGLSMSSKNTADVWSSGSIASIALLTRLVSLCLAPGGHVCGSATSQLLSLQSLEWLHICADGHCTGRNFVRELTDGLPRLQRLTGSVSGLPSAACAQLTQLTHLRGNLKVPTEGVEYVFGESVVCRPLC